MELSTTRKVTSFAATQEILRIFIESEGSLLHLQELSICTYPEPDYSIFPISIYLCLGLLSGGPFPSGFPANNLYAFLFFPIRVGEQMLLALAGTTT
jgi:hypothetical protein